MPWNVGPIARRYRPLIRRPSRRRSLTTSEQVALGRCLRSYARWQSWRCCMPWRCAFAAGTPPQSTRLAAFLTGRRSKGGAWQMPPVANPLVQIVAMLHALALAICAARCRRRSSTGPVSAAFLTTRSSRRLGRCLRCSAACHHGDAACLALAHLPQVPAAQRRLVSAAVFTISASRRLADARCKKKKNAAGAIVGDAASWRWRLCRKSPRPPSRRRSRAFLTTSSRSALGSCHLCRRRWCSFVGDAAWPWRWAFSASTAPPPQSDVRLAAFFDDVLQVGSWQMPPGQTPAGAIVSDSARFSCLAHLPQVPSRRSLRRFRLRSFHDVSIKSALGRSSGADAAGASLAMLSCLALAHLPQVRPPHRRRVRRVLTTSEQGLRFGRCPAGQNALVARCWRCCTFWSLAAFARRYLQPPHSTSVSRVFYDVEQSALVIHPPVSYDPSCAIHWRCCRPWRRLNLARRFHPTLLRRFRRVLTTRSSSVLGICRPCKRAGAFVWRGFMLCLAHLPPVPPPSTTTPQGSTSGARGLLVLDDVGAGRRLQMARLWANAAGGNRFGDACKSFLGVLGASFPCMVPPPQADVGRALFLTDVGAVVLGQMPPVQTSLLQSLAMLHLFAFAHFTRRLPSSSVERRLVGCSFTNVRASRRLEIHRCRPAW